MKIITYSDLHLEFGSGWTLPSEADGDVMIMAGDIITLKDYRPLDRLLQGWKKPVLYVTGNHEYYTRSPMDLEDSQFKEWLETNHPHVKLLFDEPVSIDGVNFFGGTMWTDFDGGNMRAMITAQSQMNDFRLIYNPDQTPFRPADAVTLHKKFVANLLAWLDADLKHPSRLDRDFGRKSWGDEGYAREELVAELGAAFLCADLELTPEVRDDHASYIASWLLGVLKNDSRAIFTAAAHAQRAVDYLHKLQPEQREVAA